MSGDFIPMVVKEIQQETSEAVSILLEYPKDQTDKLDFKPGQYITVKWMDGEKEFRRSYSLSSVPDDPYLAITIKEVSGGQISPLLARKLKAGDILEILPPEGRFTAQFGPENKRNIFLIGAGSGITPLISIARTALEKEPRSVVILLYGSRHPDQIIFRERLDQLSTHYAGQFYVYHTLSKPDVGSGVLKSLFGKKKPEWTGLKGRINPHRIEETLKKHAVRPDSDLFFLCGPGDLITMGENTLQAQGIKTDHIKKEFFTAPSDPDPERKPPMATSNKNSSLVIVHLRGEKIEAQVTNESILDTLLALGYDAPYSCHSGACATCMAKVIQGSVEMDACFALSDKEVADGYILSCQAHPTAPIVEISYDE
ncbi:MAG: ferredoxin--NADP reductase [Bacteroidota bacterium]|nr:ferredoxin--NADP reductase [Bacteroidota bacterium]